MKSWSTSQHIFHPCQHGYHHKDEQRNLLSDEYMRAVAFVCIILECVLDKPLGGVVLMEVKVGVCRIKGCTRVSCGNILESAIRESGLQ
jgi:hypothetical protein